MKIPDPRRPSLSGYIQEQQLLPWKWVDARMINARNYWISTHTGSYPSSRPVWGIWSSPRLWFSTGSAIARNLTKDHRVQVNLESADQVVIIEGEAQPLSPENAVQWASKYNEKYNWNMPATHDNVWEVVPVRILGWTSDSSGADDGAGFSNSATEWNFEANQ